MYTGCGSWGNAFDLLAYFQAACNLAVCMQAAQAIKQQESMLSAGQQSQHSLASQDSNPQLLHGQSQAALLSQGSLARLPSAGHLGESAMRGYS